MPPLYPPRRRATSAADAALKDGYGNGQPVPSRFWILEHLGHRNPNRVFRAPTCAGMQVARHRLRIGFFTRSQIDKVSRRLLVQIQSLVNYHRYAFFQNSARSHVGHSEDDAGGRDESARFCGWPGSRASQGRHSYYRFARRWSLTLIAIMTTAGECGGALSGDTACRLLTSRVRTHPYVVVDDRGSRPLCCSSSTRSRARLSSSSTNQALRATARALPTSARWR
jgi:hypothetical protein